MVKIDGLGSKHIRLYSYVKGHSIADTCWTRYHNTKKIFFHFYLSFVYMKNGKLL